MNQYVALLRGINVSGKNKIAMQELKLGFDELGFSHVITYLNSGNVSFESEINHKTELVRLIEDMIRIRFNLEIPVFIITLEEIEDILLNAPDWWGNDNKEIYDNLIFIIPPSTYDEIFAVIGEPNEAYEKNHHYENAVFWSFIRKDYPKTNWWSKTSSSKVKQKITIRTANTMRKIVMTIKN